MVNIEKTMFREYDIRGRVTEDELNPTSVELIAKGFAKMLVSRGINEVVIGWDSRESSESFANIFITIILKYGISVFSLGMVLTPMLYSAQYYYKIRGGVMITASHNPNQWNGFKLALDFSHTLVPEEIKELYEIIRNEDFISTQKSGTKKEVPFLDNYTKDILSRVKLSRKLKIVINCGNGTAGPIVPGIFRKFGCEVVEQYCEVDFNFPHYSPNPSIVEMMEDLGNKVREVGADLGFAFDGDGDRLGMTDEKGEIIWADKYLILLARQILEKQKGAKIVFDVKSSQALIDDIKNHGGVPIMWITGHSYIKAKRKEENAPLAGEVSGHIFIADNYYGFDDAPFAALRILDYISKQNISVSEIMKSTPQYFTSPALQAECGDEEKYKIVEKLTEEFKKEHYEVVTINGARVQFGDGWGLVRASSNLPVIVMRFEAKSKERLLEIEEIFKKKLSNFSEVSKNWHSG